MTITASGVDLSLQQFIDAWRLMCTGTAGHVVEDSGETRFIFSGVPIAFFNVAILNQRGSSSDALEGAAEHACSWASSRNVPWLFVVTHEALQEGSLTAG